MVISSLLNQESSRIDQDNLLHLLAWRTLDDMLGQVLTLLLHTFGAAGGMVWYTSSLSCHIRQGDLPESVQVCLAYWEQVFAERIQDGRFADLPSVGRHPCDEQGAVLVAPLIGTNRLLGFIGLFFPLYTLNFEQEHLLNRWAHDLGIVAEHVEQANVMRQRLGQLGLFYQMEQVMSSTLDIERLLRDTVELTMTVMDAQCVLLMLIDPTRPEWVLRVSSWGASQTIHLEPRRGLAGWMIHYGLPVLIGRVEQDERFDSQIDACEGILPVSVLGVPLQLKGRSIGVIEVINKRTAPEFDQEDLSILTTMAAQIAIALDNARLYQNLRAERDHIIEVEERVRHELARNLHDGPVQLLSAIAMGLDYLRNLLQRQPEAAPAELESLRQLTRQAMYQARTVLFELRPIILETQGLVAALSSYIERLATTSPFEVHLDIPDVPIDLDVRVAGVIFSIVQEAINNIIKHAEAGHVWVSLRADQDVLWVTIQDDGKGFDVQAVQDDYDRRDSLGLLNMRERARLIDAELTIESGVDRGGSGTLIQLRRPFTLKEQIGARATIFSRDRSVG